MNKTEYDQINETLYHEVLPNGLTVYLLPKNDYHKTYGLFSTNYGSIDNEFIPYGSDKKIKVPDGIAHFLEHKLFEKEDGDVFQLFGQQGASANAFTSFTKTSYLFSTTDQVENNLYPEHPLHIDIAGTVESIEAITADDLYTCYRTFYQPSNMVLFVVGKLEPEKLMELIRTNQNAKDFPPAQKIERYFPDNNGDIIAKSSMRSAITRDKFVLGIKGLDVLPAEGKELLRYKTALNLLFQLLLGNTSQNYLKMYNDGLIDDSFGFEFSLDREFHFADFSGDTDQPEKAAEKVKEILLHFEEDQELSEENLTLLKKKMLGQYFQTLNSLEYIANQFTQSLFGDQTLFDLPEIIESIQLADVLKVGRSFIKEEAFSEFYMQPNV